ncbi:Protein Shroom3 [Gossypium arboreum]|uniref:Protein Shroom3 n=1 Tax=Gossypium arboreum TaxID=29729 RepID=A0A0B0P2C5_GOSAR|nr:Protein Shroom3 [Gossypium arboreum]
MLASIMNSDHSTSSDATYITNPDHSTSSDFLILSDMSLVSSTIPKVQTGFFDTTFLSNLLEYQLPIHSIIRHKSNSK